LANVNRNAAARDCIGPAATFPGNGALYDNINTRTAIVGHRNADVGNETAPRKPGQPKTEPQKFSPAMAQQCSNSGHYSAPQKLLQLVGCREPKARPEPKLRPKPNPGQR
jgi:hypothetical protein